MSREGRLPILMLTPLSVLFLFSMVLELVLPARAAADFPDPEQCEVHPWDEMGHVLVSPGSPENGGSSIDSVSITIRVVAGYPLPGATVQIFLCESPQLCVDPADDGLGPRLTDGSGVVQFNPRVGGCADCLVVIRADGLVIREYQRIVSPDFDGGAGDGVVDEADATYFSEACQAQDSCADLDGSGACGSADLELFQAAYGKHDQNPNGCARDPTEIADGISVSTDKVWLSLGPNPATDRLDCRIQLGSTARVVASLHDAAGRRIKQLQEGEMSAGEHLLQLPLDRGLPRGMYFLRVRAGGREISRAFVHTP